MKAFVKTIECPFCGRLIIFNLVSPLDGMVITTELCIECACGATRYEGLGEYVESEESD